MTGLSRSQLGKFRNRGSTLIEVLIAMLVFGLGIAGALALQFNSIKEDFDSSQRSRAIWLAQEFIDRIRLNPDARVAGAHIAVLNDPDFDCAASPAKICADYYDPDTSSKANAEECNAGEMAEFDTWQLVCRSGLVGTEVSLSCDDVDPSDTDNCSEGSDYTLELAWESKAVADNSGIDDPDDDLKTQSFRQVFRP